MTIKSLSNYTPFIQGGNENIYSTPNIKTDEERKPQEKEWEEWRGAKRLQVSNKHSTSWQTHSWTLMIQKLLHRLKHLWLNICGHLLWGCGAEKEKLSSLVSTLKDADPGLSAAAAAALPLNHCERIWEAKRCICLYPHIVIATILYRLRSKIHPA